MVKEKEQKEMEKKLEEEKEKQTMEKQKEEREKLRRMEKEREEKEMAMRVEAETRRLERERAEEKDKVTKLHGEEKDKVTKLHGEKAKDRKTKARKSDDERERERCVKERERKTEGRKSDDDQRKSDKERERERERRARKGREIEDREREREEEERKREREKDRLAMERATQERVERIALERITAAKYRAVENREKEEMNSKGGGGEGFEKRRSKGEEEKNEREVLEWNAGEARLRAERAAVLKAITEAKERAIKKAKVDAEKERDRLERYKPFNGVSSQDHAQEAHFKRTQSDSALSQGHGESALGHKDRIMERQQKIAERAAKALAEKNRRDIMAQREQSERDRIAEHLDAEVKRWSSGKEGNLHTLLSTLQYILGQNSGWQSIHLTEVITAADVKKAYRKAMLFVHPDKLQQRGASIHQKYICEKFFDILKEAWNKFNSEER